MKLRFLPALPWPAWCALWAIAMIASVVNWVGGHLLGWFEFSDEIATAGMIAFGLLMLTPLDHSGPRVHYYARRTGEKDQAFVPVARGVARRLVLKPEFEVIRVTVAEDGVVLKEERLS